RALQLRRGPGAIVRMCALDPQGFVQSCAGSDAENPQTVLGAPMIFGREAPLPTADLRHLLREIEIALGAIPVGDVGQQAELDPVGDLALLDQHPRFATRPADAVLD